MWALFLYLDDEGAIRRRRRDQQLVWRTSRDMNDIPHGDRPRISILDTLALHFSIPAGVWIDDSTASDEGSPTSGDDHHVVIMRMHLGSATFGSQGEHERMCSVVTECGAAASGALGLLCQSRQLRL